IRNVHILKTIEDYRQPLFVYARRTSSESGPSPERVETDLCLTNGDGEILVAFDGVEVQRLGRSSTVDQGVEATHWLYQIEWCEEPLSPASGAAESTNGRRPGQWLIFADSHGVAEKVADLLASNGDSCALVEHGHEYETINISGGNGHPSQHARYRIDPLDGEGYKRLIQDALGSASCAGVVHLWSLDFPNSRSTHSRSNETTSPRSLGCGGALQLCRALARTSLPGQPRLWFVTAGAQPVSAELAENSAPLSIEQSPLIGFGRVAALELPD